MFLCVGGLAAQEIECDDAVYITTHISTGTSLYKAQVTEERGVFNLEEIFAERPGIRIGCIGYSVVDKMIYGLEFNTHELLRINAFGEITNLGVPLGLDTTLEYYSGAMYPEGRDLFVIGRAKNEAKDVGYYSIDVFDERATSLALISAGNVTVQDMARNPRDGAVFGYDSQQKKIVNVEIGQVSNYQFPSIGEQFSALFFDANFNLYGFGEKNSSVSRKFFAINKVTGTAELLDDGPSGLDADACGCPYRFDFHKKIFPQEAIPCQEVTIEYSFTNTSGSARTNLRLLDTLPEELTITDIDLGNPSNKFNGRIHSGIGSNIVDISRLEVLLGDIHAITLTAKVSPDAEGLLRSQGYIENLPLALNPKMISDNIETTLIDDPNFLRILRSENADFEDDIAFDCDNETATLTAPIPNAVAFRWDNGAASSTIDVTESGIYLVEMDTECETYSDEIVVDFNRAPNFVDLGTDRQVEAGQTIGLDYTSNLEDIRRYEWNASSDVEFSCATCAQTSIRLLEPTVVTLRITDGRGCTVEDELTIDVNAAKSIYAPTAFSPDGDGINDIFYLQGTNGTIANLDIFDRWGNAVYSGRNGSINNANFGWNGTANNSRIDTGVFIWTATVQFADDSQEVYSGTISLVR